MTNGLIALAAIGCHSEPLPGANLGSESRGPPEGGNDDATLDVGVEDATDANDELDGTNRLDAGGTMDADGCLAISATVFRASHPQSIRATVNPNLDGPALDNLWVEFFNGPPIPGTYAIQGAETNYQTCSLCVTVRTDETRADSVRTLMAISGTIVLDPSSQMSWEFAGSLRQVVLVESTIDPRTSASAPVPGGKCLVLSSAQFDTVKTAGADCLVQQDCGDITRLACDPGTKKCIPGACTPGTVGSCPNSGLVCLSESALSTNVDALNAAGICYSTCTPFVSDAGSGCPSGSECVIPPGSTNLTSGICLSPGSSPAGAKCDPSTTQLDTGCVPDYVCVLDAPGYRCRQQCDALASSANCPSPLLCRHDTHACE